MIERRKNENENERERDRKNEKGRVDGRGMGEEKQPESQRERERERERERRGCAGDVQAHSGDFGGRPWPSANSGQKRDTVSIREFAIRRERARRDGT